MEKFSVIIPTLWYSNRTDILLYDLTLCDYVGEIIIIDNNDQYKNKKLKVKELENQYKNKIKVFPQKENLYVNPAWNLGVEKSNFNNICLCNDDINFNTSIFELIIKNIHLGVIGTEKNNFKLKEQNNINPEILKCDNRKTGWGCLMFFEKSKWIKIPNELKIYYGDDILYYYAEGNPHYIKNFKISGEFSASVRKNEFKTIISKDIELFKKIKLKFKKKK